MPEAVLVSAVRTPVGRAYKGSLRTTRPDEWVILIRVFVPAKVK